MEGLEKLLSTLILYSHNFRILHWKVKGEKFDLTHEIMGTYYDKLSDFIDDVAELCIQKNLRVFTLREVLSNLESNEENFLEVSSNDDFSSEESFELTKTMFGSLIDIITTDLNQYSVATLQNILDWLNKECNYKNKRRLM